MSDDRDRLRAWMMAALDDELGDDDRRELDRALATDPVLADEWDRMQRVKRATSGLRLRTPPDEVWDDYWTSVYNRAERGVAWFLVSVGAVVVLAWAAWSVLSALVADRSVPGFLKVAIFAVIVGGLILLVSVVREKWFTGRKDPYRGVRR